MLAALRSGVRRVGAAVAVALVAAGAASEARAQALVRIAEYESVGGYVIHNDKAVIWAELRGTRVARGLIRVERRVRGAAQPILMTGQLSATETLTMWSTLYRARPWSASLVHALHVNTDFPDSKVRAFGRFTQYIKASYLSPADIPAGVPAVSREMSLFLSQVRDAVRRTAEAPFFVYEANGGRLGYRRTVTISNAGAITDEVDYAVVRPGLPQPYSRSGAITADERNELARLASRWSSYPRSYPGDPRTYDGIGITATLYRFGVAKAVFAGEPQSRPADFEAVLAKAAELADKLP